MIYNAKITSTSLGDLGKGFTYYINLEMSHSGQAFGGWAINNFDHIASILEVLDVAQWESLINLAARVDGDENRLTRIGHFYKYIWFDGVANKIIREK